MDRMDIVIIGAGVVGLATAVELTQRFTGRTIVLLERHDTFGQETSSRNSEVIHAGIYYPKDSLKAKLCVQGNRLMYRFCDRWSIAHERSGKLIVARGDGEIAALRDLYSRGCENGVPGLELLDGDAACRREPAVRADAALYSPSTGIVDSHKLMARLEYRALENNVVLAYRHDVTGIRPEKSGYAVSYRGPGGVEDALRCSWIINSAGLGSDHIASLTGIDVDAAGYRLFPSKGEYFSIPFSKAKRINHLIFPPPFKDLQGLGIHVTRLLDGTVKLGPNAFYVDRLDYAVDPGHARAFYDSVKDYLPFLMPEDLRPDMAGIRPKLQAPGAPVHDFVICHEKGRGLPGIINLIGIESPGLTCCFSIARLAGDMIEESE